MTNRSTDWVAIERGERGAILDCVCAVRVVFEAVSQIGLLDGWGQSLSIGALVLSRTAYLG